ncbi:MAG TPA: DUF4340 domain-containing protein [Acidobacteriota bacterium]|nr:DUF4340 domain-containing protein [Acidobacteriota bacterium]
MREKLTTLIFVAFAAGLAITAAWVEPERATQSLFDDQGEYFYPDFKDPLACKALEVIAYDETTAAARPFKVEFRNRRWSIPSHHNYPADARDRLAKTAAALMDLKKDSIRSESVADHATLGVIDPLDQKATSLTGRGKRVTLRDEKGAVLADFILGKSVEGKPGYRYIRVPGQKRTYAVKTDADPSAEFEDWIETDLLKLTASEIRKITVNRYSINEQLGQLENVERTVLTKEKDRWVTSSGKTARKAAVDELTAALDSLRIVNVQPKPPALTKDLKAQKGLSLSLDSILSLRQKGFFVTPTGQLLSNEGELIVETEKGLIYTLRFGEVAPGAPGTESEDKTAERRYLFITVSYNDDRAALYNDGDASKVRVDGNRLARELTNRFADWYYVISGADFEKLRPRSRDL